MQYSVLMTVYKNDNPDYFDLSLGSMVNQTVKPNEIVIVKDGPVPDALEQVINKYAAKANIVPVQLEVNQGLGKALNEGIKYCSNELIARMDSDDFSMPNRCELELKEFEANPSLDIIGCPVDEFVGDIDNIVGVRDVPYTNEDIYTFARRRDPFNHPTVMYRKSKVESVGCYSDYRKNQDTDLWIKLLSAGAVCANLKEHVFRFRFDEGTYRKRKSWINTKILIEIRYKAWKSGFNSFGDFLMVFIAQMGMYIMPESVQKFVYKKILR